MLKQIEYFIKKLLLSFLSAISKKTKSEDSELKINSDTKCLLIRLNRIGDALVTTPFISLLKRKNNCKIFILADRKNHFVFNNNPDIENVIVYEKGLKGFFKTIKIINSKKFDIVIDLHDDVSITVSFIIAKLNCKYKIGMEKSNSYVYSHTIPRPDPLKYHIYERMCSFSRLFGFDYSKCELKIIYNPKEKSVNKIIELINELYPDKKFLLGINISAGSDARFWGIENFKKLVNKLKSYDINLLLICHEKDYNQAKKIIEQKFILKPEKDFDHFAAAIQHLNMLFSPDTSALFLADSKNIPVFGLYVKYKLNELIWSPFNSDFECVITQEPTIHNISFEEVWNKFQPFLEKYLSRTNDAVK